MAFGGLFELALSTAAYLGSWEEKMFLFVAVYIWLLT